MNAIDVARPALFGALDSVLVHVGPASKGLDTVCLTLSDGLLSACATDDRTTGLARVPVTGSGGWTIHLVKAEATELMRAVRTTLKRHDEELVQLLVSGSELHVQVGDEEGVVYDITERAWDSGSVQQLLTRILDREDRDIPLCFDPTLLARFGKAARGDGDRMRLYPIGKASQGAAVVTVGDNFVGAIAGMDNYDRKPSDVLAAWGIREQEAA